MGQTRFSRTWSVPSHIPLPPLYLRRIALTGAQHREAKAQQPLPALLTEKYSGHDLTGFLLWLGKWLRLSTVDVAWLSGRANDVDAKTTNLNTKHIYHPSCLWPTIPLAFIVHNYAWHKGWNWTHNWVKVVFITDISKYCIVILHHS